MDKGNTSLILGIVGLCLEFVSIFVFGWLSIVGLLLGVIGICLPAEGIGKKVPAIVATPVGFILMISWIIALTSLR